MILMDQKKTILVVRNGSTLIYVWFLSNWFLSYVGVFPSSDQGTLNALMRLSLKYFKYI